jgi:hypothetical protein
VGARADFDCPVETAHLTYNPRYMTVDNAGNFYVTDLGNTQG